MEPSNDHERVIAVAVDRISSERNLSIGSVREVISGLAFVITKSDVDFLMHYIQWRMDNPIVK